MTYSLFLFLRLAGDNVVNKSENMDWYKGSTMMYHLETYTSLVITTT